jgi:formylglycine-generating enzyme required for sulfatase activity
MADMSPLTARLGAARAQTDALFQLLDSRALYERPVAERHRLIFYVGHLEAFDGNLILRRELARPAFDPELDRLFAFGIDPEPGSEPSDRPENWPREEQVRRYVERQRAELDDSLYGVPEQLVNVAIEHRLMHAETLAYLVHNLPYHQKRGPMPVPPTVPVVRDALPNTMVEIPAGEVLLGRERGNGFGWDNEFERQRIEVPAFRITRFKITNGEYLGFVRAGAAAPYFWTERDGRWWLRAMFGEIPLPLDWPVYVKHSEAEAFARWRGGVLPTEQQYQRAAEGAEPVNADFANWDPVPVDVVGGRSRHGIEQPVGNGWEWTSTIFAPLPGFEPFDFYPGYSADFFDGKHWVLKGGSPRTAACMLRPSFRNWFRADYPYVYAGFRVVGK